VHAAERAPRRSAEDSVLVLEPAIARYRERGVDLYFPCRCGVRQARDLRADGGRGHPLRDPLPANQVLQRRIGHLLTRPVGRPPKRPISVLRPFHHQANGWPQARRVVTKTERHQGEILPRVGFIVTNLTQPNKQVVKFYNGRGTAEQWIKIL
jgi:Transposase DDE domain group 1